jgi:hypothetical protein
MGTSRRWRTGASRAATALAVVIALAVASAGCGRTADDDVGLVRERAAPVTPVPPTAPGPADADGEAAAPPPPTAEPPPATAVAPHVGAERARQVAAPTTAAAPAAPVVKQPPPRPNRTSEAPTQEAPPATDVAPTPTPAHSTTARYAQDFPDPFVLRAGGFWYAFSTERGLDKVPVIRSTDLVHWEARGDALPTLPRWSRFGSVWAPSVLPVPGGFVLYYSTADDATGLQCLSSGFSPLPEGPYVDVSTGPFVCQMDRGGSIDPSPFRDADGRPWLTWKSEGTLDGEPTRIWSQPLAEDGRSLVGDRTELLHTSEAWEGPIVEGPTMALVDGRYHLFYSGNRWETASYGTGHAVCASPAGPCQRTAPGPVLAPHPSEAGSGGGELFRDLDGSLRLAYHAWDPTAVGYPGGLRRLRIGAVHVQEDGRATVEPLPV